MIFATERELQLTREKLQAQIMIAQQAMENARLQGVIAELSQLHAQQAQARAQQLTAELRALPGKWEAPQPAKLEVVA